MYNSVYEFIPYFESKPTVGTWEGLEDLAAGVLTFPVVNYHPDFSRFVEACMASGIMDVDYVTILSERNCQHLPCDEALEFIKQADMLLCRAVLTKCLRQERFNTGSWLRNTDSGIFLALLKRLKELDTNEEV